MDLDVKKLSMEWLSGGLSSAIASAALNPMDVAKTRMQILQGSSAVGKTLRLSEVLGLILKKEGVVGLWRPGLSASMVREMLYSGPRAGFYVPIRNGLKTSFGETDEDGLLIKVLSALTTGTLGSLIANPVDVVKIRLMTDPSLYRSVHSGIREIAQKEGFSGLYKGLVPSTLRGASIAVGELATYDHSKVVLKAQFEMQEGFVLHTVSSLITGIVATTVAAPFDLLKSRTMNNRSASSSFSTASISDSGFFKMGQHVVRTEGWTVLFRGWLPAYLRLGPHAMLCFPLFEHIRNILGLDYI